MGLRFRKTAKLGPVRLNFSKSGVGYSVGAKGYRYTRKAGGGTRHTASLPGTGISFVKDSSKSRRKTSSNRSEKLSQRTNKNPNNKPKWPLIVAIIVILALTGIPVLGIIMWVVAIGVSIYLVITAGRKARSIVVLLVSIFMLIVAVGVQTRPKNSLTSSTSKSSSNLSAPKKSTVKSSSSSSSAVSSTSTVESTTSESSSAQEITSNDIAANASEMTPESSTEQVVEPVTPASVNTDPTVSGEWNIAANGMCYANPSQGTYFRQVKNPGNFDYISTDEAQNNGYKYGHANGSAK